MVTNDDADDIDAFVPRAIQYLGDEKDLSRLGGIATELGSRATSCLAVRSYVLRTLGSVNVSPITYFAAAIASQWMFTLRERWDISQTATVLHELVAACGSEEQLARVIGAIYNKSTVPKNPAEFPKDELAEVLSLGPVFLRNGWSPTFIRVVSPMLQLDWDSLRTVIEEYLGMTPRNQLAAAVQSLVDSIYSIVREGVPPEAPPDLGLWMLNQLLVVPDLDELGGNLEWYIGEILKRVGRAPLSWLSSALAKRMNLESQHERGTYHAVGHSLRLGEYLTQIDATNANEAETVTATSALLDLAVDAGSVGYHPRMERRLPRLARASFWLGEWVVRRAQSCPLNLGLSGVPPLVQRASPLAPVHTRRGNGSES